jgi:hypothetical protein
MMQAFTQRNPAADMAKDQGELIYTTDGYCGFTQMKTR